MMMKTISCVICKSQDYHVKYPERIDYSNIDFIARKQSEYHCRIVQCKKCGLIYSNPIFNDDQIIELYRNNKFIYGVQDELMSEDYLDQLKRASSFFANKNNLLEIGCGNGCFLKKVKEFGFSKVCGIEPCKDAVSQAFPEIKENIINDLFREGIYKENIFDVVCVMHVFDHFVDPDEVLKNIFKILKRNGFLLSVTHNVGFFMTKILGKKSPMYDISHIYLYDKYTIKKLFENNGFEVIYVKNMLNRYTLNHLIKMFPFPAFIKRFLIKLIFRLKIENIRIRIMGGQMVALAQKIS